MTPDYRRAKEPGGTYFFTVVTYHRRPLLASPTAISSLRASLDAVMTRHPFTIDAMVILPDHLHCIWTLPERDCDFSTRWRQIKSSFSRSCQALLTGPVPSTLSNKREKGFWQRRFWEHCILTEADFNAHCDYVHYNPVKHGLARSPGEWAESTFGLFVQVGMYPPNWGQHIAPEVLAMDLE